MSTTPETNPDEHRRRERLRRWAIPAGLLGAGDLVLTWAILNPPANTFELAFTMMRSACASILLIWAIRYGLFPNWTARRDSRSQGVRLTLPAAAALGMMVMLFIGALIGRANPMMLAAAMISGPFVVNGWMANVMLRRIEVARHVPERGTAGDPLWVELELTNRKRWFATWLATVRDEIVSDEEHLHAEVVFTRTAAGATSRGRYQLRPMRRGRYLLGSTTVSTSFPIGFVERNRRFDEATEVLVRPRIGRLTRAWRRTRRQEEAHVQVRSLQQGGVEDEFQQLREYRAGDNTKNIHWRTTARRGELTVRDDRQAHAPPYTLLVDLWQPEEPSEADRDRVELAVSFVATLCVDQLTRNRDSELRVGMAGEETQSWVGRSGPAGIESLLDELAVVRAGNAEGLPAVVEEVLAAAGRTSVVIVSTRPDRDLTTALTRVDEDTRRRVGEARIVEARPEVLESLFTLEVT